MMIDKNHFRLEFGGIGSVLFERLTVSAVPSVDSTSAQLYQFDGDLGASVAGEFL